MVGVVWWLHLRMFSVSAFEGFMQVVWPLIFATATLLIVRTGGHKEALIYAALGSAAMGIWSAMTAAAGNMLQEQRWMGTLELVVAAPRRFAVILMPIAMAMATMGLVSAGVTLLSAWLLFGIAIPIADPVVFLLSLVVTVLAMSMLGFLLSVSAVRYRTSWALGNVLEFPGWLVCGFLVPLTLLPAWVRPISYLLAPTWGMSAMRAAAAGGFPLRDIAICLGLGIAYAVIGSLISELVLKSARRHATLSLT